MIHNCGMSIANPINRENRQSVILVATAGQTVFSISDFKIWDEVDVQLWRSLSGTSDWGELTSGFTVTKQSSQIYDNFIVTLDAGASAGDRFIFVSRRLHERLGDVTQGGTINSIALERELDRLVTIQQETRRDIGQTLRMPFGASGSFIMPEFDDGTGPIWDLAGQRFVKGPSQADIAAANIYAQQAMASKNDAAVSAAQAAVLLAEFSTHYIGAFDTDPVTDGAGNPLIGGALYFNNISAILKYWNGTSWVNFTSDVADNSITNVKMADNAINTAEIVDGAVTTLKLADSAATTAKIANDAITSLKVVDGAITTDKIADTVYSLPADPSIDLREGMDAIYGAGLWSYRTGVGVGSDAGPAFDYCLDLLRTRYGRGEVRVSGAGPILVTTPITPAKLSGNVIRGISSQACQVYYNSNTGALFRFDGAGGYTGGGIHGITLFLDDGFGSSLATGVHLQGDATSQPDQFEISDLYINTIGTSYWYRGLSLNGTARTSPQGIRVGHIKNIQIFKCHNIGAILFNAVQWTGSGIGVYAGIGSGQDFYIGGGGATLTNSTQLYFDGISARFLNLTNCSDVFLSGKVSQVQTAISCNNYDISMRVNTPKSGLIGPNGRYFEF